MADSSLPENRFYVYVLRRPDREDPSVPGRGCPFYVGKGSNGRIQGHRREALNLLHKPGRKSHKIGIIHKLWKQGLDFEEDIFIKNLTENEAFGIEREVILAHGRRNNGAGLLANLTDGGEGTSGVIRSEELRKRMSEAKKGENNPCYGKHQSKESNQKRSATQIGRISPMKGRHHSEEAKKKLSAAGRGKFHSEESIKKMREAKKGHPVSEETRQKISKAHKGRTAWNKGIPQTKEHRRKNSESNIGRVGFWKGVPRSEETKQKLRAANLGKPWSEARRQAQKRELPA